MFLTKRLTVILFVMLICNFATVSHAEEVDSYFAWVIKDYYKYAPYGILFDKKPNTIIDMRNDIYKLINQGQYSSAADKCETVEAYQKIILGENYFDEGFTELIAKLYLRTEEFDEAEQKINLLLDNAQDNLTKIRVLNLKSDLFNCKGNYQEALKITEDVTKILQSFSDEELSLINQARASRAYCGLNETQKSLELAEALLPQMQVAFGNAGIETLALLSTMFEDYRKDRRYEDCEKILTSKMQTVNEHYGNTNPIISAKTVLQLVYLYFETNRFNEAENSLNTLLQLAFKLDDDEIYSMSRRLYKQINEVSTEYLSNNNPVVLKSELGLARMHNNKGDIQQSINLCNKNLSKFKEVFGVQSNEALALMKILSKNYILLGKYSDAERVINETLTVCRDNFGDYDVRTIESLIALSDIYCRTGKYTSADALLTEIKTDSQEILENKPLLHYDFLFTKSILKFKTGAYLEGIELFNESNSLERKPSVILKTEEILENLRIVSDTGFLGTADEATIAVLNIGKKALSEYHPKMLEIMNELAESYVAQGKLINAETLTKQVFELSREHFGENNFYEWLALNTLSKIRRAEGNFVNALAIDEQALQVIEKVRGQNSLEYLISLDSIASDHALAEDFVEAIKIREQALSKYEEIVEAGDTNLLRMMTSLAENYISIKEYAEAENLCDQALAKQPTSIYVDNHISFSKNIMNLFRIKATAQSFSGDNISAAKNYEQLIQAYEIKRNSFNNNGLIISSKGKSQWFAEIIPDYKNAADTAQKAGNMNFAFYCAEFCKGRSLIDRYNDVLVSRNYSLNPYDRKHIADYKKLIPACRLILESDIARNDDTLRSNIENTYFRLSRENEEFKQKLREEYSNNLVPKDPQKRAEVEQKLSQWEESLKSFDISKNRQAIPNGACLVEFMKVSDDCLLVMFLRSDSDVQAINISVDKNFFDKCRLYNDLNSYADINSLHNDGKYLWQTEDDNYVITVGRTAPAPSAISINDSAKWNNLRKELSDELSQKIIPSIETFIGNSSHWIISPDAELNLVPFETLIYHDKMLIESVDVSYVPSLAVLNLMKKRAIKNAYLGQGKDFFAMGDAIYENSNSTTSSNNQPKNLFDKLKDLLVIVKNFFTLNDTLYGNDDLSISRGSQVEFFNKLRSKSNEEPDTTSFYHYLHWSNLPGTARELDKVSTLFESKDIFRKEQVTEKNLQELNRNGALSNYKYLLFATHGLFVPDAPEISSIVLSQEFNDDETDGYINVGEWMSYDLRSNLVYLSACESGLGGYQAGEGIVGIPYALTVAGNKDTVMSLWKVDDEATAEFTSAVFEKLSKGQSEVTALNDTKREFIKEDNAKYNNPSVWAAFLLYGI